MERPKSDNLMCPSLSIRILSGLMSLHQINPEGDGGPNKGRVSRRLCPRRRYRRYSPMNEAEVVHGLDRENALGDVEPRHVLRKSVVLDQHRHQVSSSQELHDEVQVCGILERVV